MRIVRFITGVIVVALVLSEIQLRTKVAKLVDAQALQVHETASGQLVVVDPATQRIITQ